MGTKAGDNTEADLLFGIFAVQLGFVSAQSVMSCGAAWAVDKSKSISERLLELGAIDEEKQALLTTMIEQAIKAHGGSPQETLQSIGGDAMVFKSFGGSMAVVQARPVPGSDTQADTTAPGMGIGRGGQEDTDLVTLEHGGRYTYGVNNIPDSDAADEIGRGGIGRILKAQDAHLGREIAMKELLGDESGSVPKTSDPIGSHNSAMVARFLREARVTAQLQHPCIMPVYEMGVRGDGRLYYTMQLVRGRTLADAIKESDSLQDRLSCLPHFVDMCQAIAYAHSRGVVHRDIKPENVMIGEFGETIVLDWGLAKVRGVQDIRGQDLAAEIKEFQDANVGKTMDGKAIGTPAYMSPEQAEGEIEEIDERSDVWSLGVVLYELLTGTLPFDGVLPFDIIGKVMTQKVTPVAEVNPDAPPELAAVANKALFKEKGKRYQSAQELAKEVGDYLSGNRVAAYTYSTFELFQRFIMQNKAAVLVGTIGVILLSVLGVASYQRVIRERDIALDAQKNAIKERDRSLLAERQAERHFGDALSEKAQLALADGDRMKAEVFVTSSLAAAENPVARGVLLDLYSNKRPKLAWVSSTPRLCMALTFSPKGDRLVCAAKGGVHLYDTQRGTLVQTLKGHEGTVNDVVFSKKGDRLYTGGRDHTIRVWDMQTGQNIKTLEGHTDRVTGLVFNAEETVLVSSSRDNTLGLWDVEGGQLIRRLKGHQGRVQAVANHPRVSRHIFSASSDNTIRLWDIEKGKEIKRLTGHEGTVYDVAVSPSGHLMASAGVDRTLRFWGPDHGKQTARITGHEGDILKVAFSPDSKSVATASTDQTVRIWDVASQRELQRFQGINAWATALAFSPDGRTLAIAGRNRPIRLWDLDSERGYKELKGHSSAVNDVIISQQTKKVFTASDDKTVRIWNTDNKRRIFEIPSPTGQVWSLGLSPKNDFFAFGTAENITHVIKTSGNQPIKTLPGYSVAVSPSGKILATSSISGELYFFQTRDFSQIQAIEAHTKSIPRIRFSSTGRFMVSASLDGTAKVWDIKSRVATTTLPHDAPVLMATFSPNGEVIATSTSNNQILLWQTRSGQKIGELKGHQNRVYALAFSPKNRVLASGSHDGKIKFWDWREERLLGVYEGHQGPINAIRFSKNGRTLVSGSQDQTGHVLEVKHLLTPGKALKWKSEADMGLTLDGLQVVPTEGTKKKGVQDG